MSYIKIIINDNDNVDPLQETSVVLLLDLLIIYSIAVVVVSSSFVFSPFPASHLQSGEKTRRAAKKRRGR